MSWGDCDIRLVFHGSLKLLVGVAPRRVLQHPARSPALWTCTPHVHCNTGERLLKGHRLCPDLSHLPPSNPEPAPKQLAGVIGERHMAAQLPRCGRNALGRFCAVVRRRQTGVQLSGVGYTLADDLSGIVDRESTRQVHKWPRIAAPCHMRARPKYGLSGSTLKPTISPRSLLVWQQPTTVATAPGKAP